MREDLTHALTGTPILEWIRTLPLGIEDDFLDLSGIVSFGRYGYGLAGPDLVEFIRRCLHSLLEAGAKPVVFTGHFNPRFTPTDAYGKTNDEIVETVIADWLAGGGGDLKWGDYPFTFPENF